MDFKSLFSFIVNNKVIFNDKIKEFLLDHPGLDITKSNKNADDFFNRFSAGNNSIKYKSRKSIAQYPVLFSDSLNSKTVDTINRGLEAEYASLISLILSNSAEINGNNVEDVIGGFHKNIDTDERLDPLFNNVNTENTHNFFLCGTESLNALNEANRELLKSSESYFIETTLNYNSYSSDFKNILQEDKKPNTKTTNEVINKSVSLSKTDIEKANNLQPTIIKMKINFAPDSKNGKEQKLIEKEVSIGVKCVSHIILSEDVIYYLTKTSFKNSPILRIIKWSTGEISFFKDLVFAIDEIKRTALKSNNLNSVWWRKLETIGKIAKYNKQMGGSSKTGKKDPIPVASMVVSKEDIDMIKLKNGIDLLKNPRMIYKIVKNYFLLNFLIVDEGTEVVYVFNENTKVLERYSLNEFKKKNKNNKEFTIEELYKMIK